ncbi:MAG: hypothetical protein GIW97_06280 [Candidatus Eremiobacteraeota bacterium]|nr:hypothetical protein [Candidatus Eremiobacteraeota bacterium]
MYALAQERFAKARLHWKGKFWLPNLLKGRLSGKYELQGWDEIQDVPAIISAAADPNAFAKIPLAWRIFERGSLVRYTQPKTGKEFIGCVINRDEDITLVFWGPVYQSSGPMANFVRTADLRPLQRRLETRQL